MGWSSILPSSLSGFEGWVVRGFLLLGLLTIGPWLALLTYDVILFVCRALYYRVSILMNRNRGHKANETPLRGRLESRSKSRSASSSELGSLDGAFVGLAAAGTGIVEGDMYEGSDGDFLEDEDSSDDSNDDNEEEEEKDKKNEEDGSVQATGRDRGREAVLDGKIEDEQMKSRRPRL